MFDAPRHFAFFASCIIVGPLPEARGHGDSIIVRWPPGTHIAWKIARQLDRGITGIAARIVIFEDLYRTQFKNDFGLVGIVAFVGLLSGCLSFHYSP